GARSRPSRLPSTSVEIRSQPAFGATSRDVRYRTVRKRFAAVLVLLAASITGWSGAGGVRASTTGIHWIVAASALKETVQLNPALYIGLAGQLCHSHGLALIATPAVDLAAVLSPGTPRYQAYLSLGLPAAAAKSADAVDVQAQSLETNTSAYSAFVMKAAQQ